MSVYDMVISESVHARFLSVIEQVAQEANARVIFLLDKAGQQIATYGDSGRIDPTSLASLAAGNVAATEGVAQIVGGDVFSTLYHEGKKDSVHINVIAERVILLVIFDQRSSVGLVRLRVQQHIPKLEEIVTDLLNPSEDSVAAAAPAALGDITEEDIEALFG